MSKPWRVLLADDHDIVLEGLRRVLDRPDFEIVGTVPDGRSLVNAARETRPDIVVCDITMPLLNGIDAARQILSDMPGVKVVFLTMHSDVTFATEALATCGSGYVLKSTAGEELVTAIQEAIQGRVYVTKSIADPVLDALSRLARSIHDSLTTRQREVLQMIAEGMQAKEIAVKLNISPRTVEYHKYRIMDELGVRTLAELVRYASRHGIAT